MDACLLSQVDTQNNSLDIFLNGELVAREDLPEDGFPSSPSSAPWRFGLGTLPFALDEFRLSRLPKSADWIKALMTISQDMLIFLCTVPLWENNLFLLPDLIFETPAESYFELFVRATGSPLAFPATGLPGGMSINPADGNLFRNTCSSWCL